LFCFIRAQEDSIPMNEPTLIRCSDCSGFMIPSASACPHCGSHFRSRLGRRLAALLAIAGTGSMALTLMACYGSPCASDPEACHVPPSNDLSVQVGADLAPLPDGGSSDAGH
jgi:hypothetical protein